MTTENFVFIWLVIYFFSTRHVLKQFKQLERQIKEIESLIRTLRGKPQDDFLF